MKSQETYGLHQFAQEFEPLAAQSDYSPIFETGQAMLRKLLADKELTQGVLAQILSAELPTYQLFRTVNQHDFLIYRSPQGSFSLRLYIWEPGSPCHVIHDHGSWGIMGAYVNDLLTIGYQREDDGSVEGYAKLTEKGRQVLKPGGTRPVLPFNDGIHWTGSSNQSLALSIHAYGRALRRGYIQAFDIKKDSVYRLCTPRLEKSLLAVKALAALGGEPSQAALEQGLHSIYPLVRWESIMALWRIAPGQGATLIERATQDESAEVRARAQAFLKEPKP